MEDLTPRQTTVAELISQGRSNREIAQRIGTTENVIKTYITAIFNKTGHSNRTELAVWWIKRRFEKEYGDIK